MTSEPIGSWRLLTALCIAASTTMQGASPVLACQVRPAATETVDATAGIYQADNPGLSGPMFRVRYRASITSALKGGVYLQYRDDTPVGGRRLLGDDARCGDLLEQGIHGRSLGFGLGAEQRTRATGHGRYSSS